MGLFVVEMEIFLTKFKIFTSSSFQLLDKTDTKTKFQVLVKLKLEIVISNFRLYRNRRIPVKLHFYERF